MVDEVISGEFGTTFDGFGNDGNGGGEGNKDGTNNADNGLDILIVC